MSSEVFPKHKLSSSVFRSRLRLLILASWNIPPVFGLSFLLFIQMFGLDQMSGILTTPLEPAFIVIWTLIAIWYFHRLCIPVSQYLDSPTPELAEAAAASMRKFPLHYWGLFLTYLLMAPASVIISAEIYTDFVATPVDWFRIHLVALIVSIIVGLPIFFMILDLFGRVMSSIPLPRPHITIKTKVFLIGALIPLLIDTMLVQYYWTRTGYFTTETFFVWLMLEFLAVGGSLIFVRSFAQSVLPLQRLVGTKSANLRVELDRLVSQSTDEIGVLAKFYRGLLNEQNIQSEILELNNSLLSKTGFGISIEEISNAVVSLGYSALNADTVFLVLYDENAKELVSVAQNGQPYKEEGYYRLGLDEVGMSVMVFKACKTYAIVDVAEDPRCSPRIREQFNVESALGAPLMVEGKPIGVLMALNHKHRQNYTEREVKIIESFAREAALAIHTYRLNMSRIQAELTGKEHQDLVNLLMHSTEEGIYGVDVKGKCIFVNRACIGMLGYSNESELVGKSLHALIHHTYPDGTPYPKEACKVRLSTLDGIKAHSSEEVHWRKDGSSFPVEYWSRPIIKDEVIVGAVVSFIDISERKEAEETIRHMAFHDALTGLVNRHEFENRMSHAMDSVKSRGMEHALLYLDLDQFKVVNDTCGHAAGDELLKQLAMLIHGPVRERDTVARLGGDEFGILLENCPAERAEEIANEIVRKVREYRFDWHGKIFSVGASIGVALIDDASKTTGEVLKTADMACYMSKEMGRNRVHLFTMDDADMLKRESEMSLVAHIHDALDNNRFTLYYQPIAVLGENPRNKVYGEVLVRMLNNRGEVIPAESFVASAERYNLMPDIDRWVIQKTFAHAANIAKEENKRYVFFINLSGTSFNDESFLAFVQDQLTREALDPRRICFEVTETAAIKNIAKAQRFIHAVKELGCMFALDDFGSGLSSFSYLKALDIDFLKIDGAFVRDMVDDKKDCSIVEAITQLGRSMGIQTVAEFVENDGILEKLREIGVDYAQGYGIARPGPLENEGY